MQKQTVEITTEYIKLDQLLKFAAVAENGAVAKAMIADAIVAVNGEVCTIRGKKLRSGDVVTVDFEDETYKIAVK
ncbi:MAG: RNA-binding S4 domain-containing protein [Firmicutes bacterium]|nr:RNA-binding S4 domain-containing protein [Bacillota bacterium]